MINNNISQKNNRISEVYITTTNFSKICGVSRFTIINWIKKNKINTIQTIGGHRRIPFTEVINFFEKNHPQHKENSLRHCWDYNKSSNHSQICRNCIMFEREIDYCFLIRRHMPKELNVCGQECSGCEYFIKFHNLKKDNPRLRTAFRNVKNLKDEPKESNEEKRQFISNFGYSLGSNIKNISKMFSTIKKRFTPKTLNDSK